MKLVVGEDVVLGTLRKINHPCPRFYGARVVKKTPEKCALSKFVLLLRAGASCMKQERNIRHFLLFLEIASTSRKKKRFQLMPIFERAVCLKFLRSNVQFSFPFLAGASCIKSENENRTFLPLFRDRS